MRVFDVLREKLGERRLLHNELSRSDKLTNEEKLIQTRLDGSFCKSIKIVNQVEQEYNNGWIACSERLPEYTDEYNVTVGVASIGGYYEMVTTLRYERIKGKEPKWIKPDDTVYEVIAWQPLPPKYEPKGE